MSESGWTIETLRAHLEHQIYALRVQLDERHTAQMSAVQAALLSAKEAVIKAESAVDKRLEGMNEVRGQLDAQARTFMPRNEAEAIISRNTERLKELTDLANTHITRVEWNATNERVSTQIKELTDSQNKNSGRDMGAASTWSIVISILSAIAAIVAIWVAIRT